MSKGGNTTRGAILVLVSAAAFGLMVVLAKLAYAEGLNAMTLLAMRFSLAALGMWLLWLWQYRQGERAQIGPGMLVPLIAMGAVGYVGQSFSYFTAAEMISATATGLLLYTYPVLVMLLSWLFFREALTPLKLAALVLTLFGAVMVLGLLSQQAEAIGTGGALGNLSADGVMWGLMAAIIYSVYIIAGTRFTAGISPIFASAVIISSAALVYGVWGWLAKSFEVTITPLGFLWVAIIAVVCTVLAISTFFAGLSIIGPSRTAIISTVEPAVTVLSAAVVLGERLTLEQAMGAALIMAGVLLLQRQKTGQNP
jgi:drug/metabolite transporter (DMT)-like permease